MDVSVEDGDDIVDDDGGRLQLSSVPFLLLCLCDGIRDGVGIIGGQ